jgi:MFS family permease
MSGYQTALQLAALMGFWGSYASHAIFPSTSAFQWELPVGIQLVPGVLLLLGTVIVPETPRFLADRGRGQECEVALAWLRGRRPEDVEVEKEMLEIKEATRVSHLLSNEKSFFQEAKSKAIRKRLVVGIGLMIAQNMVGLNALNYYAPMIFISAGFTSVSSSLFLTGVFGVVKLVSAIAFMFVFVKMKGNRFWLKLGTTVCGISMLVLGEKSQLPINLNLSHRLLQLTSFANSLPPTSTTKPN